MATTIDQAFREFRSNLEIGDRQTTLVSERRSGVVSAIGDKLSLYTSTPSLLIGSYDRHTMIRYLSEGDVDVMVVLHYGANKDWDCPEGAVRCLDRFKAILDAGYPNTSKRRDRNCITMKFSEFSLDVVPAFSNKSGYYTIPDSVRQLWVPTDPSRFADGITTVNESMEQIFVPLIKMVKAWNRNVGRPLRGFHLECIMHSHYRSYTQAYSYPSTLQVFFGALANYLSYACYDPITQDRVDTYLDNQAAKTNRQIAIEKAQAAAAASKEAYDDQEKYPSVAIDEWKTLFGEFFPAYG